ncbi:MAG: Phosphoribosylamine--glycine ligase [Methanobacteriota archaeon]|nr:MAG: Phosphoribosylamine--glycine ligase [Euryarchaeota archaeon]
MKSKKKILILGAGLYQVPLIQQALDMDLEVHVASKEGDYPGIQMAQYFHPVDITDEKGILNLAHQINIDGIISTATDICMPSMGLVVDELGLTGNGYDTSVSCMDKSVMKSKFAEYNVRTARYKIVEQLDEAMDFFQKTKSSCVIKSLDSSGSRGIMKVDSTEQISEAFEFAKMHSRKHSILIEEWVDGEEYGAQAIVHRGKLVATYIHSDLTTSPPIRIPIGHASPHHEEDRLLEPTVELINRAIESLGIEDGICNVDLIDSLNGPNMIEIAARMGGTCLPEVCGEHWGVNLYKIAIQIVLGEDFHLPSTPQGSPCAAILLCSNQSGEIESMGEKPEDVEIILDASEGDSICKFEQATDRFGHMISTGLTTEEAMMKVRSAANQFLESICLSPREI